MTKTSYSATFSDGSTISLKASTREYAAAWQFKFIFPHEAGDSEDAPRVCSGFARTPELAAKAIQSESASIRNGWTSHGKMIQKPGKMLSTEIVSVAKGA